MGVPAWKKLGLRVKETVSHDPLAIVQRVTEEDTQDRKSKSKKEKIDKKDDTSSISRKRKGDSEKAEKAPKRVKVPKSERAALPIDQKDQLVYLRQFNKNRDEWKFSKQKQNWIIKNIKDIPEDYEEDLMVYLKGIQGGSKDRIISDMRKVVEGWNALAKEAAEQLEKGLSGATGESDAQEKDNDEQKKDKKRQEKSKPVEPAYDFDFADRAKQIVLLLSGEDLKLEGASEDNEEENKDQDEEDDKAPESADDSSDSSDSDSDSPKTTVEHINARDYDTTESSSSSESD